jgi:hypothetical protein
MLLVFKLYTKSIGIEELNFIDEKGGFIFFMMLF